MSLLYFLLQGYAHIIHIFLEYSNWLCIMNLRKQIMKVNTNISLDPELKKNAVELFASFGLDLSTAISIFLSQSVREKRIPFEISEKPNRKTKKALKELEYMELHPEKAKVFTSVEELMEDLKS